jgi:hypothetical protein
MGVWRLRSRTKVLVLWLFFGAQARADATNFCSNAVQPFLKTHFRNAFANNPSFRDHVISSTLYRTAQTLYPEQVDRAGRTRPGTLIDTVAKRLVDAWGEMSHSQRLQFGEILRDATFSPMDRSGNVVTVYVPHRTLTADKTKVHPLAGRLYINSLGSDHFRLLSLLDSVETLQRDLVKGDVEKFVFESASPERAGRTRARPSQVQLSKLLGGGRKDSVYQGLIQALGPDRIEAQLREQVRIHKQLSQLPSDLTQGAEEELRIKRAHAFDLLLKTGWVENALETIVQGARLNLKKKAGEGDLILDPKALEQVPEGKAEATRKLWSFIQESLDGPANAFLAQLRSVKEAEHLLQLSHQDRNAYSRATERLDEAQLFELSQIFKDSKGKVITTAGAVIVTSAGATMLMPGDAKTTPDPPVQEPQSMEAPKKDPDSDSAHKSK